MKFWFLVFGFWVFFGGGAIEGIGLIEGEVGFFGFLDRWELELGFWNWGVGGFGF